MRPFRDLIPFEDARRILLENVPVIEDAEEIPLEDAPGRVLAEDIKARQDVPPFDRAAEDGYAVIAEDTFGAGQYSPKEFRVVGRINTGEYRDIEIGSGEAVEVATGAMLPRGANAVVRVEDTEREGDRLLVYRAVHPGFDVAPRGEDIKMGETVLEKGEFLTPARIGAIAALGIPRVKVFRKPRVAILPTGDELIKPGEELKPGKIYDVNSFTLSAVVKENGGIPKVYPYVEDNVEDIEKKLKDALENDIIVFSGGSSVGERDLLIDVVSRLGRVLFHGVQIKPGKPTWAAIVEGKLVLGMPGFPTSCLNDAYQFLALALRKMASLPPRTERIVKARMARRITSTLGRQQFFTVRLEKGIAYPAYKTSGAITSLANSDGYIVIPATVDLVEKDEEVEVHLWG